MKRTKVGIMLILSLGMLAARASDLERMILKADSLSAKGDLAEAESVLKACVGSHPDDSKAWMKYGEIAGNRSGQAFQSGNMTEAMSGVNTAFSALEKSIQLDDNNVEAKIYYGIMGLQVPPFFGKLNPAVQHLEKARSILERMPSAENLEPRLTVYSSLADGYKMQGRLQEAERTWKMILAITAEGPQAEAARNGLKMLQESGGAGTDVQKDPDLETGDVKALMKTGMGRLQAGQYQKARTAFEKVLSLDDKNVEAQLRLIQAIAGDVQRDYDERVYDNQDTRTHLAFDMAREMGKGVAMDPGNVPLKMQYAMTCLYMPFFVGKTDEGIRILEELAKDNTLPDSVKQSAMYGLGYGYMKKGNAQWAKLVQNDQASPEAQQVYDYYGLKRMGCDWKKEQAGDYVQVQFYLGFQDELAPQTAVWVTDAENRFVKTLYVSGFAGNVKEKQVTLQKWGESTKFETDGTTGASIDWGMHRYAWDLTDHSGSRMKDGVYKVWIEVSWWPTFRYALTETEISIGKKDGYVAAAKLPFIPSIEVEYNKR